MLTQRFLKYVSFDTQSSDSSETTPSTPKQMIFAEYLRDELISIGLQDVELDANGYLYATLPSNTDKPVPTIGFIAHMDTSPDCSGKDVKPRIIEKYDGTDIVLSEGIITSPKKFPELLQHIGDICGRFCFLPAQLSMFEYEMAYIDTAVNGAFKFFFYFMV